MARKLDELPPVVRKGGGGGSRPEKYPYDEWLDGTPTLLVEGEDYEGKASSLRSSLTGAANRRGLKIITRSHEEGFVVQAVDPAAPAVAA